MTKREVITAMLNDSAISANADYVAYLENEIKLLDKKAARAKTAPKKADAYIDAVANKGFVKVDKKKKVTYVLA